MVNHLLNKYPFLTICQSRRLNDYEAKNTNIINRIRLYYDYKHHYDIIVKKYPEHKFWKDVNKIKVRPEVTGSGGTSKNANSIKTTGPDEGIQGLLF